MDDSFDTAAPAVTAPRPAKYPKRPLIHRILAASSGLIAKLPPKVLGLFGRPRNKDGNTMDADAAAAMKLLRLVEFQNFINVPIAKARAMIERQSYLGAPKVETVGSVTEHEIADVRVRHYRPVGHTDTAQELPTIVYFHGGGWALGSLDSHDSVCRYFCNHGQFVVLSVDYRLAPENPYPAAIDDATKVTSVVLSGAIPGVDANKVVTAGDSAGGNLAAAVCLKLRDAGAKMPAMQVLTVPVMDSRQPGTASSKEFAKGFYLTNEQMLWYRDQYLPNPADREKPDASPLLAQDLSNLPPAHIAVAGFDPLRDEGEAYAERLREAGVPVTLRRHEGMIHPFSNMLGAVRGAKIALDNTIAEMRKVVGS